MSGVLLINLGTPAAPTAAAIRPWLREFLLDRRVVDLPRALWWPVLFGFVLPFRPRKLVEQYARIWRADGSPLLAIAREQSAALSDRLGDAAEVIAGMRYGQPSVAAALTQLRLNKVNRVVVLPLYPQYSHTTTASALDAVTAALHQLNWHPEVRVVKDYHDDPRYITALAASVQEHWAMHGRSEQMLMSFHGLPRRYADKGDPYEQQCVKTAERLAAALDLKPEQWRLAYQSRVGKAEWLSPYTDVVVKELAAAGVKHLDVICPGFSADCLETLDEIAIRYRHEFVAAGGQTLRYVPALNARPAHIEALAHLVTAQLKAP